MDPITFEDEINQSPINLPRAALRLAQAIAYPDLNVSHYLEQLNRLAESAREMIPPFWTASEQAESLADFLFIRHEFHGNVHEYFDPRNSFLNEVLDRRLGIPISLSVIYLGLAKRLGMKAKGIGLPGHFIVMVQDGDRHVYLDPFHGGRRLSPEDCMELVQESTGYEGPFQDEWLHPLPAYAILTRMLNNLRNIYFSQEDWPLALATVRQLRILQPEMPELLRDLGWIYQQSGSLREAVQYYEQYLLRSPQSADIGTVRIHLQHAVQKLSRLN